ncbi:hypothetical protein B0J15DRAFT_224646 [Fusarium solani]|uniref:Uncharacterized protein n=1 Tax=Fusarium solani TaxID=169388 RepID=A0A9P9L090_FUSSL|nr:uncharacterized protein B0J15DRAFT_224646 [Fusarium solani]KAH7271832.1 hypothetical protein B0J15DRAFT_224646 [Fusarium solani]
MLMARSRRRSRGPLTSLAGLSTSGFYVQDSIVSRVIPQIASLSAACLRQEYGVAGENGGGACLVAWLLGCCLLLAFTLFLSLVLSFRCNPLFSTKSILATPRLDAMCVFSSPMQPGRTLGACFLSSRCSTTIVRLLAPQCQDTVTRLEISLINKLVVRRAAKPTTCGGQELGVVEADKVLEGP